MQVQIIRSDSRVGNYEEIPSLGGIIYPMRRTSRRLEYAAKLGSRLTSMREGLGWDRKVMAKKLAIKLETYRAYEEGRNCMPPHIMALFVEVTGFSAQQVLIGRPDTKEPANVGVETGHFARLASR